MIIYNVNIIMRRQRPLTSNEKCGYTAAIVIFFVILGVCLFFAIRYVVRTQDTYAMNSTATNHSIVPFASGLIYNRVARPSVPTTTPTTDDDDDDTPTKPLVGIALPITDLPLPPLPQPIPLNETLSYIVGKISPLPTMTAIQVPTNAPTSVPTQVLTTQVPIKLSPIKQVTRVPENILLTNVGL